MNKLHLTKIHSILAAAIERGSSHAECIEVHVSGYAEPGYSDPDSGLIAVGNWNDDDVHELGVGYHKDGRDIPGRLETILEKRYGCEIEWSDEWTTCGDCNKLVRTQADSYGWKRAWIETDGEITCHECLLKDESAIRDYLESLEGKSNTAITLDIDPEKYGYVKILDDLENGFHHGQAADPKVISKSLKDKEVTRFVFKIDNVQQFDLSFSCYVHEDEVKQANDGPIKTDADVSPATRLEQGLRAAAAIPQPESGIHVVKIHGDGTATGRVVTPQEFIEGVKP